MPGLRSHQLLSFPAQDPNPERWNQILSFMPKLLARLAQEKLFDWDVIRNASMTAAFSSSPTFPLTMSCQYTLAPADSC